MDEKRSLTTFFNYRGVDLDACARERIHLINAMQPGTELLVCAETETGWHVVAATTSINDRLTKKGIQALKASLEDISPDLAESVGTLGDEIDQRDGLWFLPEVVDIADKIYEGALHFVETERGKRLLIELVPTMTIGSQELKRGIRSTQRAIFDLGQAEKIDEAAQLTVELLRELLGYDRVKIYRFLEDWTGEVLAESRADHMDSFRGMRFPSSDIPPQARELYRILPYRMVVDSSDTRNDIVRLEGEDEIYDLTQVMCRAVSGYHTEYLRNMGVGSSLSIGLEKGDRLWGIVAFHHATPRVCSYEMVSFAREIARTFIHSEARIQELDKIRKVKEMRRIEARVASSIRGSGSVWSALTTLAPTLMELIPLTGAAIVYGDTIATHGKTPPDDFIKRMVAWSQQNESSSSFATTNLQARWSEAEPYKDVACGVMIQPVLLNRVCQIIWFRAPLSSEVHWAGASESDVAARKRGLDTDTALTPRSSFDAWHEQNADYSAAWSDAEVSATKEIFTDVLDIVASQARLLTSMNERLSMAESDLRRELEQFATAASHDMRGPLRVIKMAASMAQEDLEQQDAEATVHLADIVNASNRLGALTEQMLAYTRLSQLDATSEAVDVGEALKRIAKNHRLDRNGAPVVFQFEPVPRVKGDPHLVEMVLDNLIGNAIKYHPGTRPLRVTVDAESLGEECRIRVTDNGDGVDEHYSESVFEPFMRLHRKDDVEGTGLGLAICRRIAGLLNADVYLESSYGEGARFVLQIRQLQTAQPSESASIEKWEDPSKGSAAASKVR